MMSFAVLWSFTQFALVMALTPGPNNMMLAVSAVNFGFRRTLPHVSGVAIGFPVMFLAAGIGMGSLFDLYPSLFTIIKILGMGYLIYMAWQMARFDVEVPKSHAQMQAEGGVLSLASGRDKPFNFFEAFGFQWVNPKAWTVILISVTAFTSPQSTLSIATQVLTLTIICLGCSIASASVWAYAGARISPFLSDPRKRRWFNRLMAILMLSAVGMATFF